MRRVFTVIAASIALCWSAIAQALPRGEHVRVELLADTTAVQPGKPFTLGVRFTISPRWHIYWINPGDSGVGTAVIFDLPPGFRAGDIQYPTPRVMRLPGGITNFGYESEVMLLTTVTPPADLKTGAPLRIAGHASWLECEKECIPGDATASLELPVAQARSDANHDVFEMWRNRLPEVISSSDTSIKSSASGNGREYELRVNRVDPSNEKAEFIPGPSDDVTFENVQVTTQGDGTNVRFKVQPLAGHSMPGSPIRCLVTYTREPEEQPKGVAVDIPMESTPATTQP